MIGHRSKPTDAGVQYSTPLAELDTANGLLDWLSHLSRMPWFSAEDLGHFIRAVNYLLVLRVVAGQ